MTTERQVEAGDANLEAAALWIRDLSPLVGVWGEDAPSQIVWVDGVTPARPGDWLVKTGTGVTVRKGTL